MLVLLYFTNNPKRCSKISLCTPAQCNLQKYKPQLVTGGPQPKIEPSRGDQSRGRLERDQVPIQSTSVESSNKVMPKLLSISTRFILEPKSRFSTLQTRTKYFLKFSCNFQNNKLVVYIVQCVLHTAKS